MIAGDAGDFAHRAGAQRGVDDHRQRPLVPPSEFSPVRSGGRQRRVDGQDAGRSYQGVRLVHAGQPSTTLTTKPVRGVYRSLANREIVVIDKENGGKADAINAGINAARYPLVCVIDADSLLEDDALTRAVLPFVEDPTTIAAGGIIRIANGCRVDNGRVTHVGLPKNRLAMFQVVEYLRAFLAGRVTQSAFGALLIISGAFGDLPAGPRDRSGRLPPRHHRRGHGDRDPPPSHLPRAQAAVAGGVPARPRLLDRSARNGSRPLRQRNRWQRGTMQVLGFHKPLMFNPKYGVIGLLAMPYYLIFEAVGPIIEFLGYVLTCAGLRIRSARLAVRRNCSFSRRCSTAGSSPDGRHPRGGVVQAVSAARDLLRLAAYGVLENFGYRQLATWWRVTGIIDYLRGKQAWGRMTRKGFSGA